MEQDNALQVPANVPVMTLERFAQLSGLTEDVVRGQSLLFPRDCYQGFRNALERSGIELPKGQRTHVLRHTFASHFIMNGGNLLTLQRILGHQTIQMTMRYAHMSPDHLADAVKFGPKRPVDTVLPQEEKNSEAEG